MQAAAASGDQAVIAATQAKAAITEVYASKSTKQAKPLLKRWMN